MNETSRREALLLIGSGVASLAAGGPQAAPMAIRRIPSSGEALPAVGLGTWQAFDVGPSAAERAPLEAVLSSFVQLGGKLIDSSPMYGRSEAVVGDLATSLGLHDRLFLATKVWTSGKAAGVQQMEESMRRLQTKRLDLMQVHNLLDADAHLDTLAGWKAEGRVRYVGVTHYSASAHDEVARFIETRPLDFIQINYSAGEREAERRLLPLARDKGVAVIANRPFAAGGLLRRLRGVALPAWAKAELDCESWSQLLLKFVISHPAVTCAIPATSKVAHLRENMKSGAGRMPDEQQRAKIADAIS
jgi:aryl-alcohol dehydrogenase-like predicted oxidoreductase